MTSYVQSITGSKTWQAIKTKFPRADVIQTPRQQQIGSVYIQLDDGLTYSITAQGSVCKNKKHQFSVMPSDNDLVTIHHGLRWISRNAA
jgi:hypothetical protein